MSLTDFDMADFESNVLLHLRRTYTENEAIQLYAKKLSEAEFEIGVLKSELSELRDLLLNTQADCTALKAENSEALELVKKWKGEAAVDLRVKEANDRARHAIDRAKDATEKYRTWRDKALHLIAKYENIGTVEGSS